jgi:hypothetical protein
VLFEKALGKKPQVASPARRVMTVAVQPDVRDAVLVQAGVHSPADANQAVPVAVQIQSRLLSSSATPHPLIWVSGLGERTWQRLGWHRRVCRIEPGRHMVSLMVSRQHLRLAQVGTSFVCCTVHHRRSDSAVEGRGHTSAIDNSQAGRAAIGAANVECRDVTPVSQGSPQPDFAGCGRDRMGK